MGPTRRKVTGRLTFPSDSRSARSIAIPISDKRGSSPRRMTALDIMNGPVGSFYGNHKAQWRLASVRFTGELVGLTLKRACFFLCL